MKTRSLRLRCFAPGEAAAVLALNNEPSTRRWLPSHAYAGVEEAQAALDHLIRCCLSPGDPRLGPYVLGVEHLASGELIGHVGFSPLDGDVEISYAIAERHRGRGYGAEGVAAACAWAGTQFGLPRLVAVTDVENQASRNMLLGCGFEAIEVKSMQFQGTPRRVVVYHLRCPAVPSREALAP